MRALNEFDSCITRHACRARRPIGFCRRIAFASHSITCLRPVRCPPHPPICPAARRRCPAGRAALCYASAASPGLLPLRRPRGSRLLSCPPAPSSRSFAAPALSTSRERPLLLLDRFRVEKWADIWC
ncbi:hypothetical protein PVAP13_7NG398450 [Panicum virgatum]|uniref:Uncharacterized protein n=1 Tax=Panicum virgatum TaxID=38727 RepID=A0A8T0Q7V6_PANVG|nr:hypothetical protein PVAP13_7NG398450 [Panicum virgatum]